VRSEQQGTDHGLSVFVIRKPWSVPYYSRVECEKLKEQLCTDAPDLNLVEKSLGVIEQGGTAVKGVTEIVTAIKSMLSIFGL
jgi:hypothetical protein